MARRKPQYYWDEKLKRYRDLSGRFVAERVVRGAVDSMLSSAGAVMRTAGVNLRNGSINLKQWQLLMETNIKDVHIANTVLARGGWQQMRPADWGRVGSIIKREYVYLRRFASQLAGGLPLDGRYLQRVEAYIQAGRSTYHIVERDEKIKAGFTEERNRLVPAEHCAGCLTETERGWVKIGELRPIGTRDCIHNDLCYIEYR